MIDDATMSTILQRAATAVDDVALSDALHALSTEPAVARSAIMLKVATFLSYVPLAGFISAPPDRILEGTLNYEF